MPWAKENGVELKVADDEGDVDMDDDAEALEGGDELGAEDDDMEMDMEMPEGDMDDMEAPAEDEGEGYRMQEARRDLRAANVSVINEKKIIDRVVSRVARRLLRESAKSRR